MVTYYPDIASFQAGLSLSGAQACVAKATESTDYTDPYYAGWKSQAASLGIPFSGYHYLHAGNTSSQASYAYSVVGSTPLMLDVELNSGNLTDVFNFRDAYRALGGTLWGVYLPKWYWQQIGSPDLTALGCALVSSDYTTYSDTGPGWNSYGGLTPSVWQYTDSQSFNGQNVDFNAFKGSVSDLSALWFGAPPPPPPVKEDEVADSIPPASVIADTAYGFPTAKYHVVQFSCDGNGAHTNLRVVLWYSTGPVVHANVDVTANNPQTFEFGTSNSVYLVTVTRSDTGNFPIGVAFA